MLLIDCPHCGPRNEVEFAYGGQAHVARPEDPYALTDREWAEYLFYRDNPRGDFADTRLGQLYGLIAAMVTTDQTIDPITVGQASSTRRRTQKAGPLWLDQAEVMALVTAWGYTTASIGAHAELSLGRDATHPSQDRRGRGTDRRATRPRRRCRPCPTRGTTRAARG